MEAVEVELPLKRGELVVLEVPVVRIVVKAGKKWSEVWREKLEVGNYLGRMSLQNVLWSRIRNELPEKSQHIVAGFSVCRIR